MTRTARRLAELEAIRDRSLTDDEQREVMRLLHLERQCRRKRERYASDPEYRRSTRERAVGWQRERYRTDPAFRAHKLAMNKASRGARA